MITKRKLGKTGLLVSEISWGTAEIGMAYGLSGQKPVSVQQTKRILILARNLGINLIDTAPAYGISEELLGNALAEIKNSFYICSKCPVQVNKIESSLKTSLKKLKTSYLDILLVHNPKMIDLINPKLPQKMNKLTGTGTVKFWGVSVYEPAEAYLAIEIPGISVLEVPYNFLDRRFSHVINKCHKMGIGIIARSVFFRGLLTEKINQTETKKHLGSRAIKANEYILDLMSQHSLSSKDLSKIAIQFAKSNKKISTILVGTRKISSLQNAVDAISKSNQLTQRLMRTKINLNTGDLDLRGMFTQ